MMAAPENLARRGELRHNEPMSRHTSWRVGGPAERFYRPTELSDLSEFLRTLPDDEPVFWFGRGSNLLVRDGGLRGTVICASVFARELINLGDHRVRVGVSVPCTQLSRQCIRWGYGPSEFFAGIPGSVGGALAMNAGAHGGETWERVTAVRTIDRSGTLRERLPEEFKIAYRSVTGRPTEWFVDALMQFDPSIEPSMQAQKAMLDRRKSTQPLGLPSCGSVFRNPDGGFAAQLIESAGLKGHRIGGAEVSVKHANFVINADDASAADIEALINHVQATVAEQHGVMLQHEVRIVGETRL